MRGPSLRPCSYFAFPSSSVFLPCVRPSLSICACSGDFRKGCPVVRRPHSSGCSTSQPLVNLRNHNSPVSCIKYSGFTPLRLSVGSSFYSHLSRFMSIIKLVGFRPSFSSPPSTLIPKPQSLPRFDADPWRYTAERHF